VSDDSDNTRPARNRAAELSRTSSPFDASPLHDAKLTSIRALGDDRLLTTSWDGSYAVWNRQTGSLLQREQVGFAQVDILAVDEQRMLAVFGVQRGLEVLDLRTGEPLEHLDAERLVAVAPSPTHAAAFHPDGDLLFTGAQDKMVRVWDLDSGALIETLRGHRRTVGHLHVADDSRVVSSALDGELRVWDVREGRCTQERWISQHPITALLPLGADGSFAIGNSQGEVMIWDAVADDVSGRWHAHVGSVHAMSLLEPRHFATVAADGELRVWCADDGKLAAWYDAGLDLHACAYIDRTLHIATDDGRLIALSWPPEDL
jgi:WD40 repeat protein